MAFDNDTQLLIYEFNGDVGNRKKYVGLGRTSMRVASLPAFKFCLWSLKTPISLVKYVKMCHIPLPPAFERRHPRLVHCRAFKTCAFFSEIICP